MNRLRTWTLRAAAVVAVSLACNAPAAVAPAQSVEEMFSTATKLYDEGNWPKALEAFQNFVKTWKLSHLAPEAVYYEGWCLFQMQKYQDAINVLNDPVLTKSALAGEGQIKQAECYREVGLAATDAKVKAENFAKALELYRAFQKKYKDKNHPMLFQSMLGEAWLLFKQDNLKDSEAIAKQVVAKTPDVVTKIDALFMLGQILSKQKRFDEARAVFKQISAYSNNPRANAGIFLAAETLYEAGRYAEAIAYYDRIQAKSVMVAALQRQIERFADEMRRHPDDRESYQREIGQRRTLLEQINQQPDQRPAALYRVANCFQSLDKPEEASVVYRQFLLLYPKHALAANADANLIQMLLQRGQGEAAKAETEEFKKKFPDKIELLEMLKYFEVYALVEAGKYAEALPKAQKLRAETKKKEQLESLDLAMGGCYTGLKDYPKARDAYLQFMKDYPTSKSMGEVLFRLGRAHYALADAAPDAKTKLENLAAAAKYYEQIRATYKDFKALPLVTFQLGYLYTYQGNADKANAAPLYAKSVAVFEDYVKRWPDFKTPEGSLLAPEALYQIAQCHNATADYDKAVATFDRLIKSYPDSEWAPFSAFGKGGSYRAAKKIPEMIKAYQDFAKNYPTSPQVPDALYSIAAQLENDKQADAAIKAYHDLINAAAAPANSGNDSWRKAAIAGALRIAAVLEAQGKLDSAATECEAFLAKFSADSMAVSEMVREVAKMYREAKLMKEAYAKIEQINQQNLASPAVRIACATSTIELALYEKTEASLALARAAAKRLLAEKDQLSAVAYLAIGNVLLITEQFDQARDVFTKMLSLDQKDERSIPLGHLGLGKALLALKKYDGAEPELQKAIAGLPADAKNGGRVESQFGLAEIAEAKGRLKEAVDLFSVVMLHGNKEQSARAAFHLGQLAFDRAQKNTDKVKAKDDYKVAVIYFLRVMISVGGPMGEESTYRAAQCQEGLGDLEAACRTYTLYTQRYSNGKYIDDAKRKAAEICKPPKTGP